MRRFAFWLAVVLVLGLVSPAGGTTAQRTAELKILAPSALLMEPVSGRILWERDADLQAAPASVTKLMTLLLAYEALAAGKVSLDDRVVASPAAAELGGTQIWLYPGEEMELRDIIRAVAVGSANDAAAALAEHIAGSEGEFVALMNERASALGMTGTRFQNAHGLDAEDQFTTASDIAVLSRELVLHHPEVLELTSVYLDYVRQHLGADHTEILNRNRLVRFYPGADGLKTGWTTAAGYCLAATAQRGGTRFIAVIMASASRDARDADARTLLNYGFGNYAAVRGASRGEAVARVPVDLGLFGGIDLLAADDFGVVVPKGKQQGVERVLEVPGYLRAPIRAGAVLGELVLCLDGTEIGRTSLVAATAIPALGWPAVVGRLIQKTLR
ncbi:MAG: D-alanyl-D-alanine carboxypeptidase family protein [bacterium]|nr:D-alanyl-D-alanine carboxypeptidase family protein [bacterium]